MSCWSTEVLLPLVVALTSAPRPAQDWQAEVAAGRYVEAGRSLRALPAASDAAALGDGLRALLPLDLAAVRLLSRGYGEGPSAELRGLLGDLVAAAKGDPLPLGHRLAPLLEDAALRDVVLGAVGRGALQMCRCGDPRGAVLLERIEALHAGTDWALANLGNGYRYLGRYADAKACYARLMEAYGRQAWALNFLAFTYEAEGDFDQALARYLEGAAPASPGRDGP
ncbi:MAG: tetratricopeptide repeat protein [Planctomycetota bacterium]